MSDDRVQLTTCDYNSEAAQDYPAAAAAAAVAADNDATDPPSYDIDPAAEAEEIIEMRVTGHESPLPIDNSVQPRDIATISLSQQQQQPRRPRLDWMIRRRSQPTFTDEENDAAAIPSCARTCIALVIVKIISGLTAILIWYIYSTSE